MAKAGRPPHVPTKESRALVLALSGFGIEQKHIGIKIGINDKTLRKFYKTEIDTGTSEVIAQVAGSLFKKAMDPKGGMPSVTAGIWITKVRGKWRETIVQAHEGDGGNMAHISGPVNVYLPDNGRDPVLPMKTISGKAKVLSIAPPD